MSNLDASVCEKTMESAPATVSLSAQPSSVLVGETTSDNQPTSEQSTSAVPSGVSSEDGADPGLVRRNGWLDTIARATIRKRLLHDIAPCDDEAGAGKLYRKLTEKLSINARGSGIAIVAAHLDGAHSHVHIVHDCNWNSTSCKDVFLQGVHLKARQARFNKWREEVSRTYWERLLYYLYGRGRR